MTLPYSLKSLLRRTEPVGQSRDKSTAAAVTETTPKGYIRSYIKGA